MVAVLLPAPRVATGGLDMTVCAGTDPHICICRRDGQRPYPRYGGGVPYRLSIRAHVAEAGPGSLAANTRHGVTDVAQTSRLCRFNRILDDLQLRSQTSRR